MWSRAWAFLRDEANLAILSKIDAGLAAVIAALWAAYAYFFPPKKDDGCGAIKVEANCGSAAAQGTFVGSSITVGGVSSSANCPPKSEKTSP